VGQFQFCGITRKAIAVAEEPMTGLLTLVCAATGGEVSTGVVYSNDDLCRAKRAKLLLRCPSCDTEHVFNFSGAYLKPIGD
jgi:hypothetical protein